MRKVQKSAGVIACALLCLLLQSAVSSGGPRKEPLPTKPLPAQGAFATGNYGLTFESPDQATYCPLPNDWSGSDHGTVIFLEPPRACYGAGYPSSARGFQPADVPRIEIFYGYYLEEGQAKPPLCKSMGTVTLFGKRADLCGDKWHRLVTVNVSGRYMADEPAELSATLVAKPDDLGRYMPQFKALIASIRTCSEQWTSEGAGKKGTLVIGQGPPCPSSKWH